jgi:HEAT repeat protein
MTSSDDPQARTQALASLAARGNRKDPAVQSAFRAALVDEDANIRAQAVSGMARIAGAGAAVILREALRDRDSSVRLMAVDSAGADAEGALLLQEALADRDETVRALAAIKLGQTEHALQSPQ